MLLKAFIRYRPFSLAEGAKKNDIILQGNCYTKQKIKRT